MAYETALDDWQKPEREDEGYGWPDHSVQPYRRVWPEFLDKDHEGANDVADHENRHVGRCVVSALMKQFLATRQRCTQAQTSGVFSDRIFQNS